MDKISQLMDGELGRRDARAQIDRLELDEVLLRSWSTYHLIRDTLRNEAGLSLQFGRRLHERLVREPVVIAPHTRLSRRVTRYTLPLAAGIAGVMLVGWLAVSFQPEGQSGAMVAQLPASSTSVTQAKARASANGGVNDYLTAHQEFSPSTTIHGVASYVRTVSADSTAR